MKNILFSLFVFLAFLPTIHLKANSTKQIANLKITSQHPNSFDLIITYNNFGNEFLEIDQDDIYEQDNDDSTFKQVDAHKQIIQLQVSNTYIKNIIAYNYLLNQKHLPYFILFSVFRL